MAKAEIATTVILAVVAAGLIGWDIWVAFFNSTPNEADTISGRLRAWGSRVAFLPFAWGVLAGHFWLTNDAPWLGQPWAALSLVAAGACCTVAHLAIRRFVPRFAVIAPIAYVAIGVFVGVGLWPQ